GSYAYYDNEDNEGLFDFNEEHLFPTRQALVEHQITYWTSLKVDEVSASKMCPQCGMQRVQDGRCWNMKCGYKDAQVDIVEYQLFPTCCSKCNEPFAACDCKEECQHEYKHDKSNPYAVYPLKCVKCGEFYR